MDDNAYILGYETGVEAGRIEVVDALQPFLHDIVILTNLDWINPKSGFKQINSLVEALQAKLKEWGCGISDIEL